MKRDSCGLLSSPDPATTKCADIPICRDRSEDEELFINICAADIQYLACIQYLAELQTKVREYFTITEKVPAILTGINPH